jgi:hypothetical protein
MSREKIEVITYEEDRLNYFTELMKKSQKRYKRLFKKFKNAPYLSAESEMLSDAGREAQFHGDVVEMLEKGYRKQSEGEWQMKVYPITSCSVCGVLRSVEYQQGWNYCPNCGAKMKGGAE